MEIKFKNGSKIIIVDDAGEATRSKGYKDFINCYKNHPDKYIEEVLDIKLLPYQRLLLNQ